MLTGDCGLGHAAALGTDRVDPGFDALDEFGAADKKSVRALGAGACVRAVSEWRLGLQKRWVDG